MKLIMINIIINISIVQYQSVLCLEHNSVVDDKGILKCMQKTRIVNSVFMMLNVSPVQCVRHVCRIAFDPTTSRPIPPYLQQHFLPFPLKGGSVMKSRGAD